MRKANLLLFQVNRFYKIQTSDIDRLGSSVHEDTWYSELINKHNHGQEKDASHTKFRKRWENQHAAIIAAVTKRLKFGWQQTEKNLRT